MEIQSDNSIVVLGKRGSGKTTLIRYLINIAISNHIHIAILDIVGNYIQFKGIKNVDYYLVQPHNANKLNKIFSEVYKNGNQMMVLDEADMYDYSLLKKDLFYSIINLGRNFGIGYIASARRTANIPKDFISNANYSFIFKHVLPQDLAVLREWFSEDEEIFKNLDEHEFAIFKDGNLEAVSKLDLK